MLNNLSTYLNNIEYRISIIRNGLHVLNYKKIIDITSSSITLYVNNKKLEIKGSDIHISKLDKKELLINGSIKKVSIDE